MGLDVYMWKEEVLERDSDKGEAVIKKTDVFWGSGWELGTFLQETFELANCVRRAVEPEEALESIDRELKELNYQPVEYQPVENKVEDKKDTEETVFERSVSDYKEQLEVLQEAVALANKDTSKAEYQWELWW